jgi:methionine-rich copper-binding protein CopC
VGTGEAGVGRASFRSPAVLCSIVVKVALALGAAVLASWTAAGDAEAHANLTSASPAPESTTKASPAQVQLHFGQPNIPDRRTRVSVVVPSGRDIAVGPATVSGFGISQRLRSSRELGWYRVRYTVAFVDGHAASGVFRFRVATFDSPPPDHRKWMWLLATVFAAFLVVTAREARRGAWARRV